MFRSNTGSLRFPRANGYVAGVYRHGRGLSGSTIDRGTAPHGRRLIGCRGCWRTPQNPRRRTSPPSGGMAARLTALSGPAHYLSLAVGLAVLLYLDRHTWFFNDEFAFFARIQPGQSLGLLVPYQEQWSTLPLLITLGLYRLVGLHSVLPYTLWMVGSAGVAHLLWRWMRRVGADPWLPLPWPRVPRGRRGVEDLSIWPRSASPCRWLWPARRPACRPRRRWRGRDIAFWPIAVAGLMCSDIGVFMVVLVGLVALLRRGPRAGLRVVSVPLWSSSSGWRSSRTAWPRAPPSPQATCPCSPSTRGWDQLSHRQHDGWTARAAPSRWP